MAVRYVFSVRRCWLIAVLCWGVVSGSGCGDVGEALQRLKADSSRRGEDGKDGPYGVASRLMMVQARVSGGLQTEVVYPATGDGSPDRSNAPYPTVLLLHGGFVQPQRYRWLAVHLASRGYVVVLPSHLADLAFFESGNAALALEALRRKAGEEGHPLEGVIVAGGPAVVMGHSLGGVVSVWRWLEDTTLQGLCLLASYPAEGEPLEKRANSAVLSLVGEQDKRSTPQQVKEGWERFSGPRYYGVVKGMNHFDWTDEATQGELESDGPPAPHLSEVRQNALRLLDVWLDAVLRRSEAAEKALQSDSFAGVEVLR